MAGELFSDAAQFPTNWEPTWRIEDRTGAVVGLTMDDGCYVVLYPHGDRWRPGTHIPPEVAMFIAARVTCPAPGTPGTPGKE